MSFQETVTLRSQPVRGRIKMAARSAEGKTLLRAYVGKAGDESIVDLSDNDIINIVLEDLKKVMNINGNGNGMCHPMA